MSQPPNDSIDYQHTMNVSHAHAAAREHADQPMSEGPLSNLPLILSAIVVMLAGGFVGANLVSQKGTRPAGAAGAGVELPPDVKWLKEGAGVYSTSCQGCHLPNGAGNLAAGIPPLAGSEWVTGGEKRLTTLVHKGLQGAIQVKGVTYGAAPMPARGGVALTDKQLAQVLSYVRNNWGHKGSLIMTDQVQACVLETSAASSPMAADDVLKIPADENLPPSKKPLVPAGPAPAPAAK